VDVAMPYADRELLAFVTRIPLSLKIHNSLNRAMLARRAPELLRYPMAATLVPAGMPIAIQELSRIVRKLKEEMQWQLHARTSGRVPAPRLAWANFEFLRSGDSLRAVLDDLQTDLWDRSAINRSIRSVTAGEWSGSVHPLSDQLM
jgi:asparagine synthetase B (glutamine-hydrolysing)